MNKNFLTLPELERFFEDKSNSYLNPKGIAILFAEVFSATVQVWTKGPVTFTLDVEFQEEDPEMCKKLNLLSVADIDRIDEAGLWKQYAAGEGYVWADLEELFNCTLEFSVSGGMTQIISYDQSYTDQVDEVWDSVMPFRDYVRNNIQKIYEVAEKKAQ